MTINLKGELRFDTRGLPEGYDPHKFYEYRYDTVVKKANGIESFLYKYIPPSIVQSFAAAIDPTYQFKVAPHQITPANRVKYRQMASVLQKRSVNAYGFNRRRKQIPHYEGSLLCWSPYFVDTYEPTYPGTYPSGLEQFIPDQVPLPDYLKDTTSRTRLFGSEQGTLELFKGYINSPPRIVTQDYLVDNWANHDSNLEQICRADGKASEYDDLLETRYRYTYQPTAATLSLASHDALMSQEIAYNKALAQKYAIPMLKGWSPFNRDYSLFRNIVELRDLPRSIVSLQQSLIDLRKLFVSLGTLPELRRSVFNLKTVLKDIPNEYLSYHFGWKQTFKDINDLLSLPEKMAKRYSFLIRRSGKATTFRSKRDIPSAASSAFGFDYDTAPSGWFEFDIQTAHRVERESELRLVINATFDFPPLNVPRFLSKEFYERIGIIPRPTDLYNLVPWTWLVDYFTGLGNYVELIDNINRDPSLINWGLLTVDTKGKLITDFKSKSTSSSHIKVEGVWTDVYKDTQGHHTSIFDYTCQTRQDVATLTTVNLTSDPITLSAYQKSIIGALLAQRADISRSNTFRVRS